MPPVRRTRAHPAAGPYADGWLSRRHRRVPDDAGAPPTTLPDDVLFGIFSRVSDAADVLRCAATCRRWGRVVAARAAAISRALPPPPAKYLPHLALGFFHQQTKDGAGRCVRGGPRLRFVPTASASRLLGPFDGLLAVFDDNARPVASRNGRVVLELRRAGVGLTFSIWNPMTGDVSVLPTLSGKDTPGDYACAILTGEDLIDNVSTMMAELFRLLLVYNRQGSTVLRCYSSETRRWGLEREMPAGAAISSRTVRQMGSAVVHRGVAYWHTRDAALGVRLDGRAASEAPPPVEVRSLPYRLQRCKLDEHVLAVSPDGTTLRFVGMGFAGATQVLAVSFITSQLLGPDYRSTTGGFFDDKMDEHIELPEIKATATTTCKLLWFGERSGTLIFTVGDEPGSTSGDVFAFNLEARSLEKLADGMSYDACRDLCGYEMDRAALLAWLALR